MLVSIEASIKYSCCRSIPGSSGRISPAGKGQLAGCAESSREGAVAGGITAGGATGKAGAESGAVGRGCAVAAGRALRLRDTRLRGTVCVAWAGARRFPVFAAMRALTVGAGFLGAATPVRGRAEVDAVVCGGKVTGTTATTVAVGMAKSCCGPVSGAGGAPVARRVPEAVVAVESGATCGRAGASGRAGGGRRCTTAMSGTGRCGELGSSRHGVAPGSAMATRDKQTPPVSEGSSLMRVRGRSAAEQRCVSATRASEYGMLPRVAGLAAPRRGELRVMQGATPERPADTASARGQRSWVSSEGGGC